MQSKVTQLLALLVIASLALMVLAWSWMDSKREAALASQTEIKDRLADLRELSGSGPGAAPLSSPDDTFNSRFRTAESAAGISDELASIDAGDPHPFRDTEYDETLTTLSLKAVNLKQLVSFLYYLSAHNRGMRAKIIELNPPIGNNVGNNDSGELWTADITLAYLSYNSHGRKKS